MKNVTQLFKDSCDANIINTTLKIRVSKTKNGVVLLELNTNDFELSTSKISDSSTSSNSFTIGGVSAGKFDITLTKSGVNKMISSNCLNKLYCLHVIQWNKVEDINQSNYDYSLNNDNTENTSGKCELGYYYIATVNNQDYNCNIGAYDGMLLFDTALGVEGLNYLKNNSKTIAEWVSYFCGFLNNEFYSFSSVISDDITNSTLKVCLSDDITTVETYRQALGYLSVLACGFVMFNTDGNLEIKTYSTVSNNTVGHKKLKSHSFDSNISEVCSVETSVAGYPIKTSSAPLNSNATVISISLSENPFLRGIQPYGLDALSSDIINAMSNISNKLLGLVYFGASLSIFTRPYLDLGDMLSVVRVVVNHDNSIVEETSVNILVSSFNYSILNSVDIVSNSSIGVSTSSTSGKISSSPKIKAVSVADVSNMVDSEVVSYDNLVIKSRVDCGNPMPECSILSLYDKIQYNITGDSMFGSVRTCSIDSVLPLYEKTISLPSDALISSIFFNTTIKKRLVKPSGIVGLTVPGVLNYGQYPFFTELTVDGFDISTDISNSIVLCVDLLDSNDNVLISKTVSWNSNTPLYTYKGKITNPKSIVEFGTNTSKQNMLFNGILPTKLKIYTKSTLGETVQYSTGYLTVFEALKKAYSNGISQLVELNSNSVIFYCHNSSGVKSTMTLYDFFISIQGTPPFPPEDTKFKNILVIINKICDSIYRTIENTSLDIIYNSESYSKKSDEAKELAASINNKADDSELSILEDRVLGLENIVYQNNILDRLSNMDSDLTKVSSDISTNVTSISSLVSRVSTLESALSSPVNYTKLISIVNESIINVNTEKSTLGIINFSIGAKESSYLTLNFILNVTTTDTFIMELTYDNVVLQILPKFSAQLGYNTFSLSIPLPVTETASDHILLIKISSLSSGIATIEPYQSSISLTGFNMINKGIFNGILSLSDSINGGISLNNPTFSLKTVVDTVTQVLV